MEGEKIALENPEMQDELAAAIDEVRQSGQSMSKASREFADDPCTSSKRATMVKAARALLSAVTRLLIVADMVDVHNLLKSLRIVKDDLLMVRNASSQQELIDSYDTFRRNTQDLICKVHMRQQDLKDWRMRSNLAAARAVLKKNSTLLLTASKVYVRHPELSAAKENRDFVYKQVCEAVTTVSDVAQGKPVELESVPSKAIPVNSESTCLTDGHYKLALALDEFDERVAIKPHTTYIESVMRPELEESLEKIISGAASMADSPCTRLYRQDSIVKECNALREALQALLSEYMANLGKREPTENLNKALEHMLKKTRDLRRHLRRAAIDHVSDSFLDESTPPLKMLLDTALAGNEELVEQNGKLFEANTTKLIEAAHLNCCMSNNEAGVEVVRQVIKQLKRMTPQVINAARILAARPTSQVARDNMFAFEESWQQQIRALVTSVDGIISINDFLAVSETHIIDDVKICVLALQEKNLESFEETGLKISGRSKRICQVVQNEMNKYESCSYTETVFDAILALQKYEEAFKSNVQASMNSLINTGNQEQVDENKFIAASNNLYDGVRQVRAAVLQNGIFENELDSETELDYEETYETRSKSSVHTDVDEFPDVAGISNTRDAYRFISDEDKEKIALYVENFRTEKNRFDQEVAIWDDNGNDIIGMAKKMCKIMMDMTDFTRGRGPLKTTMDIINAAKKISDYGTRLDKIAMLIADQSPESETKKDLLGYLKEIALYCHQLNITSKVKADVQNISGNLIVSGLDSATSLIQAAKNLMNAVVSTVKASYVASTMYNQRQGNQVVPQSPIVKWEYKKPEKKPLVRKEKPGETWTRNHGIQREKKKNIAPLKVLNDFQHTAYE